MGVKRMDDDNDVDANTQVAFTTDWRLVGTPQAAGVFSLTASAGSLSDTVFHDGAATVAGYRYKPLANVTGRYDFVEVFAIRDDMGVEIYRGYHGFVETAEALETATGSITYIGDALGEIAYTPFTGRADVVGLSGGTATITANFSARTTSLTLTFGSRLEIRYPGLVIETSGDFVAPMSATPTVTVDGTPDTTLGAMSSAGGAFYGWDRGVAAPAEVGGRVDLVGTDAANFANLLFLGAIRPIDPICTGASACGNIAALSMPTNLAGMAVNPADQSIYSTVAYWLPAGVGGTTMAAVRSVEGSRVFSNPQLMTTFLDLDAGMPNGNSYAALTGDFGDGAMEMTEGYDFVQAYTISNSVPTKLYRGVHGIPFGGTRPDSGRANYKGRFLMQDGQGWFGGAVDEIVSLDFSRADPLILAIPGDSIPADRAFSYGNSGLSVTFAPVAGSGMFEFQDTDSRTENNIDVLYSVRGLAGIYGFDENAFGEGMAGPDEVAGVVYISGATTPVAGNLLQVLFVAD